TLEVALEEDRIARNPAHGGRVEKAARRDPRVLSEDEVRGTAEEVPPRFRSLVWTLALAGLRIGEASALRVKNVTETSIRVVESSAEVAGRKITGPTKTGASWTVDIPVELRRMLRGQIPPYSNAFDPEAFVFTSTDGGQVRQNHFRKRVFQPAAERAGITPTPPLHELRPAAPHPRRGPHGQPRVHAPGGGGSAGALGDVDDREVQPRLSQRTTGEGGAAGRADRLEVDDGPFVLFPDGELQVVLEPQLLVPGTAFATDPNVSDTVVDLSREIRARPGPTLRAEPPVPIDELPRVR